MRNFNPSQAQQQRAFSVAHLSYSIGNLWVLPSLPSIASRILDNRYRYYMDRFLLSIHNVLTEKKRTDTALKEIIGKNILMDAYRGENGFTQFVHDMMLEAYLDYYGKPKEIFPFVWSAMKELKAETYFDAVDKYCTFCEKFIPNRAERIIDKLSKVLAAAPSAPKEKKHQEEYLQDIDIQSLLILPENFKVIKSMPEDPENSVTYGMSTPQCNAFIQAYPIRNSQAMSFDDTQSIIEGIHHALSDTQALIEVKNGETHQERPFIYSIIKNKQEPIGVAYFLLLHVKYASITICISAHFLEIGMTGQRDTIIWEMACRKGITEQWNFDPYDKDFKHPFLMNLSEQESIDEYFPYHPLTQYRLLVKHITEKL